jgi:VIT1/CCC1 family predicted Fe2+/Mn2+ transporter
MLNKSAKKAPLWQTRYSFGSTAAIMTNLALMVGLDSEPNAKVPIIGGILVIAIADNLSDTFGIHMIYQESENLAPKEIIASTVFNFFARIIVSLSFILLILLLPIYMAVTASVVWGLLLLAIISYIVAKKRSANPFWSVLAHLLIAVAIIAASEILGSILIRRFGSL